MVRHLGHTACSRGIEQMRFTNIEVELQPMAGLAVIERAQAPANDRVRAGLQVQIRFRSHRLDDIHDRRKSRGRINLF